CKTLIVLLFPLCLLGCTAVQPPVHQFGPSTQATQSTFIPEGQASWYGGKFHGRPTASGEKYDKDAITAAHVSLPFQTRVRVPNTETGKSIVVRINDRRPQSSADKGRVIDLSEASFAALAPTERGLIPVLLELVP